MGGFLLKKLDESTFELNSKYDKITINYFPPNAITENMKAYIFIASEKKKSFFIEDTQAIHSKFCIVKFLKCNIYFMIFSLILN